MQNTCGAQSDLPQQGCTWTPCRVTYYVVAQENRLELTSLCAHKFPSHVYVGTSCNTIPTAAATCVRAWPKVNGWSKVSGLDQLKLVNVSWFGNRLPESKQKSIKIADCNNIIIITCKPNTWMSGAGISIHTHLYDLSDTISAVV